MPTLQGFFSQKNLQLQQCERINGVLYQCFVIILCCLMLGRAAAITRWNYGKNGKRIPLLLRNSIVMECNETPLPYAL